MPETALERKRRLARERKRRHKQRMSQENEYEREIRRRKECLRQLVRRLRESEEQMLEKRRIDRERAEEERRNSLQEEIEEIRRKNREIMAKTTARLSLEEIEERRRIARERIALKRRNSSQEETEERRRKQRERTAERRRNETEEAAFRRRQKAAENMRRLRSGIRIRNVSATVSSSTNSSARHASLPQPTDAKFRNRTGSQFEKQCLENRELKVKTHSVQPSPPARTKMPQQMQVPQHLQASARFPVPIQPAPPPVQVLALPVVVAKPKPVEKPRPQEKRIFVVADHQRCVMSNLASLWKSGKLCDAGIGNGSSTVMVHKVVLYAMSPKLLSLSNTDIMSHEFLQVNFPGRVSTEALNAFAEYMYNGILDLDHDILEQLKIIAKRLDMKEFEQLCDSHLPKHIHQPVSAAPSFTNVLLIQTTMPIPGMTSPLASLGSTASTSTSVQSAPPITAPVIDKKQEIPEAQLVQVKEESAAVFSQESEVASSGNATGSVSSPVVKIEPVGPEDDKYGHWYDCNSNQAFTSTTSSSLPSSITATADTSIAVDTASLREFAIPFSEATDIKSTKLKATHSYGASVVSDLSPVPNIVETVCSQSLPLASMNASSSKPLSQPSDSLPSVNLPNCNDAIYPIRLLSARGDTIPMLTTLSSDNMTVNSFIPGEKT